MWFWFLPHELQYVIIKDVLKAARVFYKTTRWLIYPLGWIYAIQFWMEVFDKIDITWKG